MTVPINPDKAQFADYARACETAVVPLVFRVANDGLFGWSAFALLEAEDDYAFLLESVETGKNGRYSFMGNRPRRLYTLENGKFYTRDGRGKLLDETPCDDPMSLLEAVVSPVTAPVDGALPPLLSGVVGYAGYDCVHYFEPVGDVNPDELGVPDMMWMETDWLIVFDHYRQAVFLIKSCHRAEIGDDWAAAYEEGKAAAQRQLAAMNHAPRAQLRLDTEALPPPFLPGSNFTREEFCDVVETVKSHIRAGDIFQAVPSQRFSFEQKASTLDIYRALRRLNPSPYMFLLKGGDFSVAGSSPELMLNCRQRNLLLRPIAGTKPRGATEAENLALERELKEDAKEIAEHLMLVDLGRNDLGSVSEIGSIRVPGKRFCHIERYSHVMHMVSDVTGILAEGRSPFDAARATFPAGTLSGAPKVRAMQIINELEPCKRNLYGGFAGYMGHGGDIMTCIVIRTLVAKGGRCHVQAGGGIVADSVPEKEYQESVNKAMAVLRAAQLAAAR